MTEDAAVAFTVSFVILCILGGVVAGVMAGINATDRVNNRLQKIGVQCVNNPERIWVHNNCLQKDTPVSIAANGN